MKWQQYIEGDISLPYNRFTQRLSDHTPDVFIYLTTCVLCTIALISL